MIKKIVIVKKGLRHYRHGNDKMLKTVGIALAVGSVATLVLPTWVSITALGAGALFVASGSKK